MNRYLLNVAFIGTRFRGIQKTIRKSEKHVLTTDTVQGCLELALRVLRPQNEIQTIISSRTDAGVHALHSTLHVDLQRYDSLPYDTNVVTGVLNRTLNKQNLPIRILSVDHVPDTFHCRYHARGRTYLYRLAVAKTSPTVDASQLKNKNFEAFIPVEELDRCCFLQNGSFDIERCKAAAPMFLGRHDFRTFMSVSKSRDHPMFAIRHVSDLQIRPGKSLALGENAKRAEELYDYWDIEITGKSFLYKQVRRIVGTFIALATDLINEKCIYEMLTIPSKNTWNTRILPAPAFGLYLCRVHYDPEDMKFSSTVHPSIYSPQNMSFLEQLQSKRKELIPTSTVITTATGERYLETHQNSDELPIRLEKVSYGFVEDTKPDTIPAEILPNFLYLGSQDAVSMENIKSCGLTHILSVGVNAVPITEFRNTIEHKYLPLLDLPETKLFEGDFMEQAFQFIAKARTCGNGRVLIHCNAGVSRAASIVLAYLISHENMSFEQAYALVKSKRECIQPNAGFMRQLRGYNQH